MYKGGNTPKNSGVITAVVGGSHMTQAYSVARAYSRQSKYENCAHILFRLGISNKIHDHRLFYVLITRKTLHLNVRTSELYKNMNCPLDKLFSYELCVLNDEL